MISVRMISATRFSVITPLTPRDKPAPSTRCDTSECIANVACQCCVWCIPHGVFYQYAVCGVTYIYALCDLPNGPRGTTVQIFIDGVECLDRHDLDVWLDVILEWQIRRM
jgi:hypothetical protein